MVASARLSVAMVAVFNAGKNVCSAFNIAHMQKGVYKLEMSSEVSPELPPEEPQSAVLPQMSQAMPFLERPVPLTGELAVDVGFDPLCFAKSEAELINYRKAEIKHARLAMLAAAGWPISEVLDKKIAAIMGLSPLMDMNDCVPSLLNGGIGKVSPIYWGVALGLAAAIDLYGIGRAKKASGIGATYLLGDLGFDPLGLYPNDQEGQKWMQLAEVKNGRLAMIAIIAFAVQEAISKVGVVDKTPLFFFPLQYTLQQYANSGYIQ